jgi:hypothetical protein
LPRSAPDAAHALEHVAVEAHEQGGTMQIHPEIMKAVVAEHVGDLRRDAEQRRMLTPRIWWSPSGRVFRFADGMTRTLSMLVPRPRPRRGARGN